ncbi:MAG: DUF2330 domain-containing protein [Acidobacteriota bacterium]|nr:DUF2330 domain-containing protein [Acidobacteriota bacterium]
MNRFTHALFGVLVILTAGVPARAFCGFYIARADAQLFNEASRVVLVREGDRTVLTMANDFRGELDEFAIVIPVPTSITRDQIHVAESALIDHLDAYTAPRLVEYFDDDPCRVLREDMLRSMAFQARAEKSADEAGRAASLGVTIEASYTVGEYDILILSAKESGGLVSWLVESGYRLPEGAEPVVRSYLGQGMRFFVAKVNLDEQSRLGYRYLRPLQVAYESPKFMLPIRLGTVNADGPQELFVYALTKNGRVETTNYRTVKLPTGMDLPVFVKQEFPDFYRDMFAEQVRKESMRTVFVEYAWDMAWCDPCAADPLSRDELRELGVFWLDGEDARGGPAQNVFVTRLHVRYDREHFPEDLVFQETGDRTNFQGRYVLRHPWTGNATCDAAKSYRYELGRRHEKEAQALASLTGWDAGEIRDKMGTIRFVTEEEPWWKRLWKR